MKRTIVVILLFVAYKAFSQNVDIELIPWSPEYKLTWSDFKGQIIDSINGKAATCARIEVIPYYENNSLIYRVTNNFLTYVSFVDSVIFERFDDGSPNLLDHEQLHFDIAEIHTRLIRKRLRELRLADSLTIERYVHEVEKLLDARSKMDSLYDHETANSLIKSKQKEWELKVENELNELDSYYVSNNINNTPHNNGEHP